MNPSMSCACKIHGGRCQRPFSLNQITRYGISDVTRELKAWLIAGRFSPHVVDRASHMALPKPLDAATLALRMLRAVKASRAACSMRPVNSSSNRPLQLTGGVDSLWMGGSVGGRVAGGGCKTCFATWMRPCGRVVRCRQEAPGMRVAHVWPLGPLARPAQE
eukprot:15472114-Alexandrium_andersonii.AAC.1